jgi:hypothetical protein
MDSCLRRNDSIGRDDSVAGNDNRQGSLLGFTPLRFLPQMRDGNDKRGRDDNIVRGYSIGGNDKD